MPRIYNVDSGDPIGEITDEQLQFLIDELEEEDEEDQDYYITKDTLEMLTERGGDPALIQLLTTAMGEAEDIEIAWDDE
ncbi:MAG TPA: hypothetical protein VL172_19950 [Kofleriaceae bacterium]|nr:hypothetical protein [Kofleriaceae bacterium]